MPRSLFAVIVDAMTGHPDVREHASAMIDAAFASPWWTAIARLPDAVLAGHPELAAALADYPELAARAERLRSDPRVGDAARDLLFGPDDDGGGRTGDDPEGAQ